MKILCWIGLHRWLEVSFRPSGYATLYGLTAVREWAHYDKCARCRRVRVRWGFVRAEDERLSPGAYVERWPVDAKGKKMPIATHESSVSFGNGWE